MCEMERKKKKNNFLIHIAVIYDIFQIKDNSAFAKAECHRIL